MKNNYNISILRELSSISNDLDKRSLHYESDILDRIIKLSMPLSNTERDQLGRQAPGSQYNYFTEEEWDIMREKLVNKRPNISYRETDEFKYDPELTAFTPGETLDLLSNPKVTEWFEKIKNYKIPEEYKHIILVPCAASKPWGTHCPGTGKYYKAYNEIKEELKEQDKLAFWVTISEPLGIVPEDMWDSFPGYDVPGLFKNRSQQMSGTETREYKEMFGETRIPPFDEQAYKDSIKILGDVIGGFIMNNLAPDRRWISFVNKAEGPTKKSKTLTTHTEMINDAINFMKEQGVDNFDHTAYPKSDGSKGHARKKEIKQYLSSILEKELSPLEKENRIGYKVVGKKDDKLFSLQNPNLIYNAKVGEAEVNEGGFFLGTTKEFVIDYYSGLTDERDALLTYTYSSDDLISGNPDEEGEVKVGKATLVGIEVL